MPRQYTPRVPRVCARCGVVFHAMPSSVARGGGIYCSHACCLTRVECSCAACGASITVKARRANGNAYCGLTCLRTSTTRHGETRNGKMTPEYRAWHNMKMRCLQPANPGYPNYGGRGITVCDRWRDSFEAFLADIGRRPSPGHSIDRIDNERGYEPDNVKWSTPKEQAANRRPAAKRRRAHRIPPEA